ncbi:protein FAR1-RELATED SEQUENCE 4-like isoform X4 [Juglans microcarpa x Juglans regia]|uniref:protein FAR1-RELATED SEQUENCE 4-like isoform X4 n=1 Tax=Juglans microcarpa x Juglans regia TaxID=2249226 RepID=UPI001B7D9FAD|nr:protein FAR1-RELATED SEQUENCE 4-like isoform X4 [Juglans microcarpa x Juglans regia]
MGKEEAGRSPKPSTSMSSIQEYYSPVNPYYPPFMMLPNTYINPYPNPHPYPWGSQHPSRPPLGPTLPYPSSSNSEELRGSQETSQVDHPSIPPLGPTLPYPSSSNPDELRRFQETSQHPSMPPLGPTLPYPLSSSLEEFRRSEVTTQRVSDSSTMPNSVESEKNVGGTSHTTDQSYHISSEDKEATSDVHKEAEGTNDVSNDDERVEIPKSGMEFATEKELLAYYKRYAKQVGFGVKTQRTKREANGSVKYVTIGCARSGKYHPSHGNVSRSRPTIKTDCKAKINAHLANGVWVLTTVEIAHNHTVSPQNSRFFRSHKFLDEYSQRMLDLNDKAGVRMDKNFNDVVVDAGGSENLEFAEKDCLNFIDKAIHLRLGKGCGKTLSDYFDRMREMNDGLVSVMDMDDEFRVKNVFWADARSRAVYEYFGDVITFDTTFLTNRYSMPFVAFVGVNHHGQSILLGAGLISGEDTSTFVWLFRAWLKCMHDRAPKAIITNHDQAMKSAISIVFPDTRHRYCLWHIMRKLPEKLGSHSQFNAGLKTSIQSALYDSQTCGEFEDKWGQLLDMYNLGSNTWLQGLYNDRSFWVPVYLKNVFWAGMSTTQRSERMNAFFDGFVYSGTTLKEFVDQFENALKKKVEVEAIADFNSFNQTIPCLSPFGIEKQFQTVYTNAKFKEVQREVLGMILCNCTLVSTKGCISTFDVLDQISIDDHVKRVQYLVYYNEEECEVKCTCALFEMRGIFCRHAFSVYNMKNINVLPKKYILDRWRNDLKRRYTLVKSSYDDLQGNTNARRYEVVVKRCLKLATRVSPSDEHYNAFLRHLDEFEPKCEGLTFESKLCSANVEEKVVTSRKKK